MKKKVDEITKIHIGNSKTEENIQSSSSKIEEKKEDVKVDGKPTTVIAGDSIVKDVKGWLMSRDKRVKVYSFSGANIEDMEDFLTPIIRRKPDEIILHVGTNNLQNDSLQSASWILAEFYFNRGLQKLYTGTCIILQKTINGFLCLLIVFLKSKTYQLILKGVIKLNRNLR